MSAVSIVAKALEAHREDIERGALLSIDEAGTRVRVLPLRRSAGSAVARRRPDCHTAAFVPPWLPTVWTRGRGTGWGNRNSGAPFPLPDTGSLAEPTARFALVQDKRRLDVLASLRLRGLTPAALCAAGVAVRAAVAAEQSGSWGVSDPHLAAPFFAPRPARRGSLTPHMHVTIVRREQRDAGDTAECGACVERGAHVVRINCARASDRFFRETAFI